jgi:diketogulonate reductase-like aldo/keto reductase
MVEHLEELFGYSDLVPAVNQIEFHPFIYEEQKPVLELCKSKGIVVEAYSPLTVGRSLNHPEISKIAKVYGKTNAQLILGWCIQHGTVPIPRSSNPSHIKENLNIFDFEISQENMERINRLSRRSGWFRNTM